MARRAGDHYFHFGEYYDPTSRSEAAYRKPRALYFTVICHFRVSVLIELWNYHVEHLAPLRDHALTPSDEGFLPPKLQKLVLWKMEFELGLRLYGWRDPVEEGEEWDWVRGVMAWLERWVDGNRMHHLYQWVFGLAIELWIDWFFFPHYRFQGYPTTTKRHPLEVLLSEMSWGAGWLLVDNDFSVEFNLFPRDTLVGHLPETERHKILANLAYNPIIETFDRALDRFRRSGLVDQYGEKRVRAYLRRVNNEAELKGYIKPKGLREGKYPLEERLVWVYLRHMLGLSIASVIRLYEPNPEQELTPYASFVAKLRGARVGPIHEDPPSRQIIRQHTSDLADLLGIREKLD